MNKLIIAQQISDHVALLSDYALDLLADILTYTELKKGDFFLKEGDVCMEIGYIYRGMVRQYYYKNSKDLTEYFAYENKFVLSIESCFQIQPSQMLIEALEPTCIYGIPYTKLLSLAAFNREIANFYRRFIELSLIISQKKLDSLRLEPAVDRYSRLMKTDPEIIKRAPLSHIASFLLMTPETLSRVRANII